jgi:hypothetical protein
LWFRHGGGGATREDDRREKNYQQKFLNMQGHASFLRNHVEVIFPGMVRFLCVYYPQKIEGGDELLQEVFLLFDGHFD